MSAGISMMYRDSGGCDYRHRCHECWYFRTEKSGQHLKYFCQAHPFGGEGWKGDYMACKTFLEREKDISVKEETDGQYKMYL